MSTKIEKKITLVCDGEECSNTFFDSEPVQDATEQRNRASIIGWTKLQGGTDLCPACSRERAAEKEKRKASSPRKKFVYGKGQRND